MTVPPVTVITLLGILACGRCAGRKARATARPCGCLALFHFHFAIPVSSRDVLPPVSSLPQASSLRYSVLIPHSRRPSSTGSQPGVFSLRLAKCHEDGGECTSYCTFSSIVLTPRPLGLLDVWMRGRGSCRNAFSVASVESDFVSPRATVGNRRMGDAS